MTHNGCNNNTLQRSWLYRDVYPISLATMSAKAFPKRILLVIVFLGIFPCTSVILLPVPTINSINACPGDNVTMSFEVNATDTFNIRGCEDQEMLIDIGEGKPESSGSYEGRVIFISKDPYHILLVLLNVSNTDACRYTATGLGTRSSVVDLKMFNSILQPDITIENTIVPSDAQYACPMPTGCDNMPITVETKLGLLGDISISNGSNIIICKNSAQCRGSISNHQLSDVIKVIVDYDLCGKPFEVYVYLIDIAVEILVHNKPVDLNGMYSCHENCDALTILTKTHRSMLANISIIVGEIAEVCTNVSVCTYTLKPTTELTEVNIAVDFGIVPYKTYTETFQVVVDPEKLLVGKQGSHNVEPIFYVPLVILVLIIIFASVILVQCERKRREGRQSCYKYYWKNGIYKLFCMQTGNQTTPPVSYTPIPNTDHAINDRNNEDDTETEAEMGSINKYPTSGDPPSIWILLEQLTILFRLFSSVGRLVGHHLA